MPEVRLLRPEDAESLYELLTEEIWAENAVFPVAPAKVRSVIDVAAGITPWAPGLPMSVIGVIGNVGKVEASIGLVVTQFWYTEEWHLEDCWTCVSKRARGSNHATALLKFGKIIQRQMNIPLMMGVLSDIRTEAKVRYFRRELGDPVGAVFVWPALRELKAQVRSVEAR